MMDYILNDNYNDEFYSNNIFDYNDDNDDDGN